MQAEKRILSLKIPKLKPSFTRWNKQKLAVLFPNKNNGRCGCGCGKKLAAFRKRWASKECEKYALFYLRILQGKRDVIFYFVSLRDGMSCRSCGVINDKLELDHILPICKGGGGQWLDNYQILCQECHREKTKEDVR